MVRDQLDDVPGRVVEVERPGVPVRKVEYLVAGGQLVEALPGRKKGEVVEGLALARDELELRLADPERRQAQPPRVEVLQRAKRVRRRAKPHAPVKIA